MGKSASRRAGLGGGEKRPFQHPLETIWAATPLTNIIPCTQVDRVHGDTCSDTRTPTQIRAVTHPYKLSKSKGHIVDATMLER